MIELLDKVRSILTILPYIKILLGVMLCFLGYHTIKIIDILLSILISIIFGFSIGFIIFGSTLMSYLITIILAITLIFFLVFYFRGCSGIFLGIISCISSLVFLFSIFGDETLNVINNSNIYIYLILLFLIIAINYKFFKLTTIFFTSFYGAIIIISTIPANNIIIKTILIVIFGLVGIYSQYYLLKLRGKKKVERTDKTN